MPDRIQLKRVKGFRLPPGAVSCSRPGKWGNPYTIDGAIEVGFASTRPEGQRVAVAHFRNWITFADPADQDFYVTKGTRYDRRWMRDHLADLRGRDLACWCVPGDPCHADVLLALANAPVAEVITGPSGGVLGKDGGMVSPELLARHPEWAKQIVQIGRYPRTGHDRARWETVRWEDYRARVGIGGRAGPWRIWAHEAREDDPSSQVTTWVAEAESLPPTPPGCYAELLHDERGLVMSDVPAEVCGALPFLDHVATLHKPLVLIAGLGLGIVPAWLLSHADPWRVDVIEIDPDVIRLTTSAARSCAEPGESWADDPRLHVYEHDAHTWWPANQRGCALHSMCRKWHLPTRYAAAWLDIWDTVSPHQLPSMDLLEHRYGPLCDRVWSWERAECEAMRDRGQTVERPCWVSETGYLPGGEA